MSSNTAATVAPGSAGAADGAPPPNSLPQLAFEALPDRFVTQLFAQLSLSDVKALRSTCSALAAACARAGRLTSLRGTALLTEPLPSLSRLPPVSFLDLNARNADCGHRLISALRKVRVYGCGFLGWGPGTLLDDGCCT
jgi:hypothetical protein